MLDTSSEYGLPSRLPTLELDEEGLLLELPLLRLGTDGAAAIEVGGETPSARASSISANTAKQ